jgi:ubiquinone/menaquinone biosynthesis C-methylase UbiE
VLHLGSGAKDLGSNPELASKGLQVLNLDIAHQDLQSNPGRLRLCADAETLPLRANSVGLICSEHVFEHFPCPQRALGECHRVLKEGGHLVISGPNGSSYIALLARVAPIALHKLVHRLGSTTNGHESRPCPTFYRFSTRPTIRRMALNTGFNVVSIQTFVGEPCYTTWLPVLHLAFIVYHKLLQRLNRIFDFHITSVVVLRKVTGER